VVVVVFLALVAMLCFNPSVDRWCALTSLLLRMFESIK
jgi:hypothetical protein